MKASLSLILAFTIGAVCRYFDVPLPSPTRLFGALLVLATTLGYLFADRIFFSPRRLDDHKIDTADAVTKLPKDQ